jgi:hypothetical protein
MDILLYVIGGDRASGLAATPDINCRVVQKAAQTPGGAFRRSGRSPHSSGISSAAAQERGSGFRMPFQVFFEFCPSQMHLPFTPGTGSQMQPSSQTKRAV